MSCLLLWSGNCRPSLGCCKEEGGQVYDCSFPPLNCLDNQGYSGSSLLHLLLESRFGHKTKSPSRMAILEGSLKTLQKKCIIRLSQAWISRHLGSRKTERFASVSPSLSTTNRECLWSDWHRKMEERVEMGAGREEMGNRFQCVRSFIRSWLQHIACARHYSRCWG